MFLTRKHLSRRTVLKGAGVTLALPFLDAMVPAGTAMARTAAAPKLRAGFFYIPHGAISFNTAHGPEKDRWTPSGSGANFKLNDTLQPLEPFKRYVSSVGNLQNEASRGSVHTENPATWLSCTRPAGGGGANMAPTLDQIVARKIGQDTALPSLEVAAENTAMQGAGSSGPYRYTLSFRDATSPLPMEYNPKKVFNQLFGETTAVERVGIARENGSFLDLILDRTRELQNELGPADRVTLDRHLQSVREIERRTEMVASQDVSDIHLPERPVGVLDDFDKQVDLQFDLIALAFQSDLTCVASYFMVAEGTNRTYNHIGVPDAFHPVSHHANDLDRMEKLVKIQRWHIDRFAAFLKKLADTPDGDGTLLDHSIFLYGSNMGNSDRHSNYPLPTVVVGGGGGRMKLGGQHIAMPDPSPLANVHLTLLNKFGIEQKKFADSTGIISEL
jgi:hypothetical protein